MAMPVLPLLLLPLTIAVADAVPTFSTEPTCRGGLTNPSDNDRFRQCMAEEAKAKATLQANWATFPAADRGVCANTAGTGSPSYVELLTCLQMDADARKLKYKAK